MSKAVGYARVGTTGQADDGVSLAAQEAKIRAWADLNGYEEVELHSDPGLSGAKMETRKGGQMRYDWLPMNDRLYEVLIWWRENRPDDVKTSPYVFVSLQRGNKGLKGRHYGNPFNIEGRSWSWRASGQE